MRKLILVLAYFSIGSVFATTTIPSPTPAPHKKAQKAQKPKFNRNSIWCGDTHIKNQNADHLGDYCKNFSYKHKELQFRDDRSGDLIACKISGGTIKTSTCSPIK